MKAAYRLLLLAIPALLGGHSVAAKEGPDQYPNGAENFMAGALPPPGQYFLNYFGYYSGTLHDNNGDKVPGVEVNATFDALRYIYVSQTKILGGDWAVHMIVPLVHQRLHTPGGVDSASGLGDMTINPLVIGWHLPPDWHFTVGIDFYVPSGKYSATRPAQQIGTNYYSVEPVAALTYLNQSGFEVSAKLMYSFNGKNRDTDYHSGDQFHMDYLVGQHVGPWAFGIGGYYLKQTTDDKRDGEKVGSNGNRGQVFALGPAIKYDLKVLSFVASWDYEMWAENRFQGNKFFLKLIAAF